MNELQIFHNDKFGEIRTIEEESGRVFFCGADIAKTLGYKNPSKALSDHCRCITKRYIPHPQAPDKEIELLFITEGDIYRLAAKSTLPGAAEFESWIFDDVLPTIRKHGLYAMDELLDNPDVMIAALTALKEERQRVKELTGRVDEQRQLIEVMEPQAAYCASVLNSKGLVATTNIAKDYGKSAKWLNEFLREKKIQYKTNGTWHLYQDYADKGYAMTKTHNYLGSNGETHSAQITYWTQAGRKFIYELLAKWGIYPVTGQPVIGKVEA